MINNLALCKVYVDQDVIRFGVLGYCQTAGQDECSRRGVGYALSKTVENMLGGADPFPRRLDTMTNALVLHPIATAVTGIAFIFSFFGSRFGHFLAAILTLVAFLVAGLAMAMDFAIFSQVIKATKNFHSSLAFSASYGPAIWITVIAAILLFFSCFITVFDGRRRKNAARY